MVRVLQVVTNMDRGGLETILMNYYRHIDRDKVQFDFLTHRDAEAAYDKEIICLGGKIFHLPRLNPFSRSYREALNTFFKEHPEYRIVHVHQDCMSSVILKAAKENGVPVRIAHSHSSSQDKNLKYPIKLYYRKQIPIYATDLMSCGVDAGDWMFCHHNFKIVRNAIDAEKYIYNPETRDKIRQELGIAEKNIVLGHVGRFYPAKNHFFLIDLFSSFYKRFPEARLLMIGNDQTPIGEECRKKVEENHLEDKVIFTGVRSDVPELLQAMDVFVFPSLYEGLPVTLVEAQANGLPCVISTVIPDDCVITDLIHKVSLDASDDEWIHYIRNAAATDRVNYFDAIVNAGFDIKSNAKWLEDYYVAKSGQ